MSQPNKPKGIDNYVAQVDQHQCMIPAIGSLNDEKPIRHIMQDLINYKNGQPRIEMKIGIRIFTLYFLKCFCFWILLFVVMDCFFLCVSNVFFYVIGSFLFVYDSNFASTEEEAILLARLYDSGMPIYIIHCFVGRIANCYYCCNFYTLCLLFAMCF